VLRFMYYCIYILYHQYTALDIGHFLLFLSFLDWRSSLACDQVQQILLSINSQVSWHELGIGVATFAFGVVVIILRKMVGSLHE
jgi:hypothetical protein